MHCTLKSTAHWKKINNCLNLYGMCYNVFKNKE
uniref:Uncharacterized protein n=1 Tax=Anguilla anguilla TaxID=7936 RepID=A0A0E9S097_ANGAN